MSEQDQPLTPEQEKRLDALLSDGQMNPFMARAAVRGYFEEGAVHDLDAVDEYDPNVGEESQEEPPLPDPHRRVPPHNTKPGYVRDFHDGGRADEYRGGDFGMPQTAEAQQARDAALPVLQEMDDDIVQARLMMLLGEGITNAQIQALWRKHVERRDKALGRTDDTN